MDVYVRIGIELVDGVFWYFILFVRIYLNLDFMRVNFGKMCFICLLLDKILW